MLELADLTWFWFSVKQRQRLFLLQIKTVISEQPQAM